MAVDGIEKRILGRVTDKAYAEVDAVLLPMRAFLERHTSWNYPTPFQTKSKGTGQFCSLDRQSLERGLRDFMADAIIEKRYQVEINRVVDMLCDQRPPNT